jgi:thioredoxin-related protein
MFLQSRHMLKDRTMKWFLFLLAVIALAIPASECAQPRKQAEKAELKWKPFEAGFAEAQQHEKKVLLDVYTDWCKWCKKLDQDVYNDQRVISYLSQHYTVVKLNAEDNTNVTYKRKTSTKAELAGAFGVNGYPTIIFFDSKGDPINSLPGYVDADKFLTIAKYIGEDYYKTVTWEKFQKMGDSGGSKE